MGTWVRARRRASSSSTPAVGRPRRPPDDRASTARAAWRLHGGCYSRDGAYVWPSTGWTSAGRPSTRPSVDRRTGRLNGCRADAAMARCSAAVRRDAADGATGFAAAGSGRAPDVELCDGRAGREPGGIGQHRPASLLGELRRLCGADGDERFGILSPSPTPMAPRAELGSSASATSRIGVDGSGGCDRDRLGHRRCRVFRRALSDPASCAAPAAAPRPSSPGRTSASAWRPSSIVPWCAVTGRGLSRERPRANGPSAARARSPRCCIPGCLGVRPWRRRPRTAS